MSRTRMQLITCVLLGAAWIAQAPVRAQPATGARFTSIRYGYALTLAPGWLIAQGDCAPAAVAVSADRSSSMEIRVSRGSLASAPLRQAEAKALRASGQLRGVVTYGTLRLRNATYQTARAISVSRGVTRGVLVAGVARNQYTYLLIDTVRDPASRTGQRSAKAGQDILASVTFVKPAPAGSFICSGTGTSRKPGLSRPQQTATQRAATATPRVSNTPSPTRTPVMSSTPTATPRRATDTPSPTATPPPSSTVTPTDSASPTGTPTVPPTNTPTWTPSPTWTPTATWTPTPTWTVMPTETPNPSGIPTTGSTDNGCAITPDQAAGESHLLALLNADRAAAGASPLTLLPALSVASRDHSCDMGQHNNLSHTGSDGSNPFQRMRATGTVFNTAGENIGVAFGYGLIGGIDIVDQQMMAEPLAEGTHHWNIVNAAFHRVGIGVINLSGTVWITEDFVD